jgi:hypothetical protein
MTITERVSQWRREHSNMAFCDECVAAQLNLSAQQVFRVTSAPGAIKSIRRYFSICHGCRAERLLTGVAKIHIRTPAPAEHGTGRAAPNERPRIAEQGLQNV